MTNGVKEKLEICIGIFKCLNRNLYVDSHSINSNKSIENHKQENLAENLLDFDTFENWNQLYFFFIYLLLYLFGEKSEQIR